MTTQTSATQTSATPARISCEFEPPVARVTLRNPPRNVIDLAMMDELSAALADLESRPDISVVIFAGHGKTFSAGVDIAAHTPDKIEQMLSKFHRVIRSLVNTRKITIASVQGHCLGGGAELAMICDLVYTAETANWAFPEIKLGCFPPVAATALAAIVGPKQAADLILTGRSLTGAEAEQIGLVNRAVPDGQLKSAIEETVKRLSELSPSVLQVTKKALYHWDAMHFDKGLARTEKVYLEELSSLDDMKEGTQAFLEKRKPKWKGR